MAYRMLTTPKAVFVVWGRPRIAELHVIVDNVIHTAERANEPVVYINRIPADAEAPNAEFRKALDARMPGALRRISSYHVVLEGNGFGAALKRAVLATVFLATGKRGVFHVHANATDVVSAVKATERDAVVALLREAESGGLLTSPMPTSVPPPPMRN